jgi:nitrogen-specific signal transduction histidine kinase
MVPLAISVVKGQLLGIVNMRGDEVQAEEALKSQKFEAVARLAGGMAHDFNNLITIMGGYAELVRSNEGPLSPQRLQESTAAIAHAAERGGMLVERLLMMSGRSRGPRQVIDASVLIRSTEGMLRRLVGEDVEVRVNLAPKVTFQAGVQEIENVIMQLAVNARDAMPSGGILSIRTARDGPQVMIEISDTGTGIEEHVKERLFEPYVTTKAPGRGTGMGLAMVFGAVRQHGGKIAVESEWGRGATFRVYFPWVDGAAETHPEAAVAERSFRGDEVILVVDDERFLRLTIAGFLKERGYTVLDAEPEDATQLCRSYDGPIDLLLTDLSMPGVGGRELAERVIGLRPSIKVLFMSGYNDEVLNPHLEREFPFLQKPFTQARLAQKIREILD